MGEPSGGDWDPYSDVDDSDDSDDSHGVASDGKQAIAEEKDATASAAVKARPCKRRRSDIAWPVTHNFCLSCKEVRPGERNLSRIVQAENGSEHMEFQSHCRQCFDELAQI